VSITGNHCQSSSRNAIQVRDSAANVSVTGNHAESIGGGSGIAVQGSGGGFSVSGNIIPNFSGAGVFAGGPNVSITGNAVVGGSGNFGIALNPNATAFTIANNLIDAANIGLAGLRIDPSNGLVSNNAIIDVGGSDGVITFGSPSDVHFRSNYFGSGVGTVWPIAGSGSGFTFVGNQPRPTFDSAPSSPVNFQPYIATASWDPDGDGNGEVVMTDNGGTAWQEIVNLPNT
jgi:hypothetical protein